MKKQIRLIIGIVLGIIGLPMVLGINATSGPIYDLTNSSLQDDIFGFMVSVNDLTEQMFMIGVLLVSFVILLVAFREQGTNDALLGAGFITSIITVLFTALNLVPRWIAFLIIIPYGIFFAYRMVKG